MKFSSPNGFLVVVLLVGALVFVAKRPSSNPQTEGPPEPSTEIVEAEVSATTRPVGATQKPSHARRAVPPSTNVVSPPPPPASKTGPVDGVDQYLQWAQYPPLSRPLKSSHTDVIYAHRPIGLPKKVFLRPAKNQPTSSSVHHNTWAVFTGNLRHVFEGDAVHTQLVVARGRSGTSPHLQLQNPEIEIAMFLPDEGVVSLHKGRFLDDGRGYDREANDGIYSFSFVPSQVVPKGASGEVKMRATYAIPFHEGPSGTTWKEGMSMFRFSYYQKAPMEFTGRFRETIEEGSLVVYAGVKIQQPGWYKLRSLLFDATGAPVAQSMIDEEFDTNVDEVRFVFFGRVLRQHKVGGPYTVGRVDGYLFEPGVPPPRPQVRAIVDGYETRTYEPTAFSDAEWDSPAKQRRLDLLREVRSKGLPY